MRTIATGRRPRRRWPGTGDCVSATSGGCSADEGPGRLWIPSLHHRHAPPRHRELARQTPRAPVIPAYAGRLSWRGQAADESSPWRSGVPAVTGPRWPPLVCGLLVFASFMPVSVEAPSRPKTGTVASYPCSPEQTQVCVYTLKSRHGADANLIHLRHKTRHPPHAAHAVSGKERPMPCPAKGSGPRLSAPVALTGAHEDQPRRRGG
jgi:hypothetical protein